MPALKPQDRLVQVKGRPGTWFRLQKSGGSNSRLQHVDLPSRSYRLDDSFLVANGDLMKQLTYSEYLRDSFQSDLELVELDDTQQIEVDAEVYAKIQHYMGTLSASSPNDVLRKLFKL